MNTTNYNAIAAVEYTPSIRRRIAGPGSQGPSPGLPLGIYARGRIRVPRSTCTMCLGTGVRRYSACECFDDSVR